MRGYLVQFSFKKSERKKKMKVGGCRREAGWVAEERKLGL
jgi:hypothetical protein